MRNTTTTELGTVVWTAGSRYTLGAHLTDVASGLAGWIYRLRRA